MRGNIGEGLHVLDLDTIRDMECRDRGWGYSWREDLRGRRRFWM